MARAARAARRILRWTAWAVAFLALVVLIAGILATFTPIPDRLARASLDRALAASGGRLTTGSTSGTLIRGLDLTDVHFSLPPDLEVTARRIHVRVSPAPLLVGLVVVRDVRLEDAVVTLRSRSRKEGEGSKGMGSSTLFLRVPRAKVKGGRFVMIEEKENGEETVADLRDISFGADVTLLQKTLHVTLRDASFTPPAPLPEIGALSGSVSFGLGSLKGRFDLRGATARSGLALKGTLDAGSAAAWKADADLHPLAIRDLAAWWKDAPDLTVEGRLNLGGSGAAVTWSGDVRGAAIGALTSKGEARWKSGVTTVRGDATLDKATPQVFLPFPTGREATLSGHAAFDVTAGPRDQLNWRVTARLGAARIWGFDVGSSECTASGDATRGEASGSLVSPLAGAAAFSTQWGPSPGAFALELASHEVRLPEVLKVLDLMPPMPGPVRFPEGPWSVSRLLIDQDALGISVEAEASDPAGARITLETAPIGKGLPIAWKADVHDLDFGPWGWPIPGAADFGASFEGPSADEGTLALKVASFRMGALTSGPFDTALTFTGKGIETTPTKISTNAGAMDFGPCRLGYDGTWSAPVTLDLTDVGPLADLAALPSLAFGGRLKGSLTLRGEADGMGAHGDLQVEAFAWGEARCDRLTIKGVFSETSASDLGVAWERLALSGAAMGDGSATFRGTPAQAGLTLSTALGEGRLLSLTAAGSMGNGSGQLTVLPLLITIGPKRFTQDGPLNLRWDKERVAWSGLRLLKNKSLLESDGWLALGEVMGSSRFACGLKARHIPLAILPFPTPSFAGYLDGDLSFGGTVSTPEMEGSLALTEGSFAFPRSDLVIAPVTATLKAHGNRLVLTGAKATTPEGGQATASGYLAFKGIIPRDFEVKAEGGNFPFVLGPDLAGRGNFRITLKGTIDHPVIDGEAEILKAKLQLPDLAAQDPLPTTIRFTNAPVGSPLGADEVSLRAVGPLRGSLKLFSEGGLWVTSTSVLAELTGSLTVRFTSRGPALDGTLTVSQGRYIFQGKKCDLVESRVSFNGSTDLLPILDVTATYTADATEITIHVTGPADHPKLHLSSQPPMNEADILATFLFGKTGTGFSPQEDKTVSAAAATLALQYQTGPILESLQKGLRLDTLAVGPAPQGGTQLSLSRALGDRTLFEYRQVFGAEPESRLDLRYRVNRTLSLSADSSTRTGSGVDVLWEQRY